MGKGVGTLKNLNILEIGRILFIFAILPLLSGIVIAQIQIYPAPTPKQKTVPKPKTKVYPKEKETPVTPPADKTPLSFETEPAENPTPPAPFSSEGKRINNPDDIPIERSIEVDSNVNLNLCVSEGNVRINGWNRNEVRVFVSGGSKVGFRIGPVNKQSGKTASLTVLGYDPKKDKGGNLERCLFGDEIELDVPIGTRINKLEGRDAEISIKSVAKVVVENENGDISLSEIEQGIRAKTFDGDISVENSAGAINLENYNGNIIAHNIEPIEAGDTLKAKANSSVVLQRVSHSVIDATSTSGLIKYTGELVSGGQYRFVSISGQIFMAIPLLSSAVFEIVAEKNKFYYSEFKFNRMDISKVSPTLQKVDAQCGEGDAQVKLQSESGRIMLIKLN